MANECCRRQSGKASAITALAGVIGAMLAPKCPFCLAAYLAVIGVGAGFARALHPFLAPLCLGVTLLAIAALVRARRRRS